jgi:hypothetical protein
MGRQIISRLAPAKDIKASLFVPGDCNFVSTSKAIANAFFVLNEHKFEERSSGYRGIKPG